MNAVRKDILALLVCERCKGAGEAGMRRCPECLRMCAGVSIDGVFCYFGLPITRFHISLRRARRVLDAFRIIGAIILGLGFLGLFAWQGVYGLGFARVSTVDFWTGGSYAASLLWLSVLSFGYLLYRVMRHAPRSDRMRQRRKIDERTRASDPGPETWSAVRGFRKKMKRDISRLYEGEALLSIEHAYRHADSEGAAAVDERHIFRALLRTAPVRMVFLRLGISAGALAGSFAWPRETPKGGSVGMPRMSPSAWRAVFRAYQESLSHREPFVQAIDLLAAVAGESPVVQAALFEKNVDARALMQVISWERMRARLRREYLRLAKAGSHHNKYGLDRAMTAVATPFLNTCGTDLTMQAAHGRLPACVGRDKELEEITRIVEAGRQHVLLVGDHGVGKVSLIEGIAERMVEGAVPPRLMDKRLVRVSVSELLSGATVSGAQERLIRIVREVSRAKNVVLFFDNIHELMGAADGDGAGMSLAETLSEYADGGRLILFATTTPEEYAKHMLHSALGGVFTQVIVREMNEDAAVEVLESKAGTVEYEHDVFFSYDALQSAAQLAKRFLRDAYLPESALTLLTESASMARKLRGQGQMVAKEDVAAVLAEKTGIPVGTVSGDESAKLLRLEEALHERVIGQDEAVSLVANALRRARAEIRQTSRPIAAFLFLGPTGVGKTELAKTIADVYFGGEDRMIRLDMSEFQDASAVERLLGQPGKQGTGLLTEAVRARPFSLILLDELEKADAGVLNIFLQVFDDGRLTDSTGRVIDFTNAILIATSNAGTAAVERDMAEGVAVETIRDRLIHGGLDEYYRPEFLNRFDAIVLFHSLSEGDIKRVAEKMLHGVSDDLSARGIALRVEDAALDALADAGFDPQFGARPMRRAIQEKIENPIAEMILSGTLERLDTVVVGDGAEVRIEHPYGHTAT